MIGAANTIYGAPIWSTGTGQPGQVVVWVWTVGAGFIISEAQLVSAALYTVVPPIWSRKPTMRTPRITPGSLYYVTGHQLYLQ